MSGLATARAKVSGTMPTRVFTVIEGPHAGRVFRAVTGPSYNAASATPYITFDPNGSAPTFARPATKTEEAHAAMAAFVSAAVDLSETLQRTQSDIDASTGYPPCLPDFNEFVHQLQEWRDRLVNG